MAESLSKMADARLKWPVIGRCQFKSGRCTLCVIIINSIFGESGWPSRSTLTVTFDSVFSPDFLKGLPKIRPRSIELRLKATVNESYVKLILLVDISKMTFDSIRF